MKIIFFAEILEDSENVRLMMKLTNYTPNEVISSAFVMLNKGVSCNDQENHEHSTNYFGINEGKTRKIINIVCMANFTKMENEWIKINSELIFTVNISGNGFLIG